MTFVDMNGHGNLATALANHLVDGFIGAEPFPTLAVQDSEAQKITSLETLPPAGRWQNHACCTVKATEAVISKHRDQVKKLEELLILATHEVNQNRDGQQKMLLPGWVELSMFISIPGPVIAFFTTS
nr:ABC transporter substrate-binding protein [Moorella humiferrea]